MAPKRAGSAANSSRQCVEQKDQTVPSTSTWGVSSVSTAMPHTGSVAIAASCRNRRLRAKDAVGDLLQSVVVGHDHDTPAVFGGEPTQEAGDLAAVT